MEWVETTGRTIEEAQDRALDQLGVDEHDAEFQVLEEPRSGLFGRLRQEARVRARVRPTKPPPKVDQRDRRRRRQGAPAEGAPAEGAPAGAATATRGTGPSRGDGDRAPAPDSAGEDSTREDSTREDGVGEAAPESARSARTRSGQQRRRRGGRRRGGRGRRGGAGGGERGTERGGGGPAAPAERTTEGDVDERAAPDLETQGGVVTGFLQGLVEAFDVEAEVVLEVVEEDELLEVNLAGDDLGRLIGPRAETLYAIQELAKTVLQRHTVGQRNARIRLDVGGYRRSRREALERFTRSLADDVRDSGVEKALEPMAAADRKVVHDTVNLMDGVTTLSEGREPRRRVVIVPDRGTDGPAHPHDDPDDGTDDGADGG